MKSELQQTLIKQYPHFFEAEGRKIYTGEKPLKEELDELLNQKEIVLPIQFGFECGDGWYMLLEQLLHSIEWHLDPEHSFPRKERIPLHIQQIKEKFGGLRFYYSGGDNLVAGMVSFAESLSYHICERCGSTQNVTQTEGWIETICENCKKNENKGLN